MHMFMPILNIHSEPAALKRENVWANGVICNIHRDICR